MQNAAFSGTTGPEGIRWTQASSEHYSSWYISQQFKLFPTLFHINVYIHSQSCSNIIYVEEHSSFENSGLETSQKLAYIVHRVTRSNLKVHFLFNQNNQSGVTKRKHDYPDYVPPGNRD